MNMHSFFERCGRFEAELVILKVRVTWEHARDDKENNLLQEFEFGLKYFRKAIKLYKCTMNANCPELSPNNPYRLKKIVENYKFV